MLLESINKPLILLYGYHLINKLIIRRPSEFRKRHSKNLAGTPGSGLRHAARVETSFFLSLLIITQGVDGTRFLNLNKVGCLEHKSRSAGVTEAARGASRRRRRLAARAAPLLLFPRKVGAGLRILRWRLHSCVFCLRKDPSDPSFLSI